MLIHTIHLLIPHNGSLKGIYTIFLFIASHAFTVIVKVWQWSQNCLMTPSPIFSLPSHLCGHFLSCMERLNLSHDLKQSWIYIVESIFSVFICFWSTSANFLSCSSSKLIDHIVEFTRARIHALLYNLSSSEGLWRWDTDISSRRVNPW